MSNEGNKREVERLEMDRRIHEEARKYGMRGLAKHMFAIILTLLGLLIVVVSPDVAEDYFRVFTLAMGTYIILFAVRIIQINRRIIKHTQGAMKALPLHIQAIAVSYIIYCISLHAWVISRFGNSEFFWYGLPFIVVGDVIGIFALGVIWRFQEVRRKAEGL